MRVRFEDGEELTLDHEAEGVWTAVRAGATATMDYRLLVAWADGIEHLQDDPYRFAPTLGEIDLHLVGEGRHEQLWTVLGARVHEYPGPLGTVRGTSFAVWAPRAKAVRVVGDFNGWDGRVHPMRLIGSAASGSCSSPTSARAPSTSTRSAAPTTSCAPRPTRWPAAPSSRRAPAPSSTRPSTSGPTPRGWTPARRATRTPAR